MLDLAVQILAHNDLIGMMALKVKDVIHNPSDKPYIGSIYKTGVLNCNQGVIRSDVFKKIGYFDESFKNYGIDPDLTTKVLLSGYRVVYTKAVAIHHYRDHDTQEGAISRTERTRNRDQIHQKYDSKYAYLIDCDFSTTCKMQLKSFIWHCIKTMLKRGHHIETLIGKNRKDWKSVTHCRYNSIFDFYHHADKFLPMGSLVSEITFKGIILTIAQ